MKSPLATASGLFTWTPTEAQGPASYPVTIRVTDNGSPPLNDSRTITITVNEVNLAPVLSGVPSTVTINEEVSYTFTATEASRTVPVALALFPGVFEVPWGDIAAASILASLPPIVIVVGLQRWLVQGLTAGAVKD